MSVRQIIRNNPCIYYYLKGIRRRLYIRKMSSMSQKELMEYDSILFERRHGRKLDWSNLRTYSEKMQWEKIFDKDPMKATLSDKYLVRNWVAEKIGANYLIPLVGVWDNVDEIDFQSLPNQFVLKTNCASGDVIIVRDKAHLSKSEITGYKAKLKYYMNMKFGFNTLELHYNDIKPKIVCESLIVSKDLDLQDYKFLCFDGTPVYCWVDTGRYHEHRRNVYNLNWELQDWNQYRYGVSLDKIPKPKNFDEMVELARQLSSGFKHVRVDLYNNDGTIYFGEMTFTNASGFEKIEPAEADLMLGDLWNVDTKINI